MAAKTVTLTTFIPEGLPGPEHFTIVESVAPTEADLAEGGVLLQVLVMSADPYLRSKCKDEEKAGQALPMTMTGFVAGKVLASKRPDYVAGDLFGASLPFTTVQAVDAAAAKSTLMWKLSMLLTEETISHGIGVLGMPGSTAYGGLLDVLRPDAGAAAAGTPETLWVSGSAGAVGGMVAQIAKNVLGCKVIGSCGGPEKVALCVEKLGLDGAVDYKKCGSREELSAALKELAPDGVDMYFDNVGGIHFEAAMAALRPHGRVAICGGISRYNEASGAAGELRVPEKFFPTDMIYSFQRVEGFMCLPWLSGQKGHFLKDMSGWLKEGKVKAEETFFEGIDAWPMAFQALFTGGNKGKVVVRI